MENESIVYLAAAVCLSVLAAGMLVCFMLRACRVPPTIVPDSWVFLLIGGVVAAILEFGASSKLEKVVRAVDSSFAEVYFAVLLPPVIFLAGLQLDLAGFFGRFWTICCFAFLGTFISAIGIAVIVYVFACIPGMPPFSFVDAFLLGSILSATDTVAVIATFDSLHVRPELYSLVFGESVFNDAVAIVLFHTLAAFESSPVTLSALAAGVGSFLLTFILSTTIGLIVGILSALLFKYVRMTRHDGGLEVEKALLATSPLITYMLTEGLGLSGVVAVLFTGIIMGRFTSKNINVVSRQFLLSMYRVLSLVCESLAFCYIGIALPMLGTSHLSTAGWATAVTALAACLAARGASTWLCTALVNIFRRTSDRISPQIRLAVWMSGLRGGVAFALAIASKDIVSTAVVGVLMPPTALFVVLVTSVAISGTLPFVLRRLDLVVASPSTARSSSAPTSDDPAAGPLSTLTAPYAQAPESRSDAQEAQDAAQSYSAEDERAVLMGVASEARGGELPVKRSSPRSVVPSSPEHSRASSLRRPSTIAATAVQEYSLSEPHRPAEGARTAALASMQRAAVMASRSLQAAAEVVLVRKQDLGGSLQCVDGVDVSAHSTAADAVSRDEAVHVDAGSGASVGLQVASAALQTQAVSTHIDAAAGRSTEEPRTAAVCPA